MYECSKYTLNSSTDNAQFIHIRLVELQHHFFGRRLFLNVSLSLVPSFIFVSPLFLLLPACFRSETRIILMKLKFKTCRIHSTWKTFNPNLPRRISSPTFDADVVVIRCQSALLCRSIILKHVYFFFCKKLRDPYRKKAWFLWKIHFRCSPEDGLDFFFTSCSVHVKNNICKFTSGPVP